MRRSAPWSIVLAACVTLTLALGACSRSVGADANANDASPEGGQGEEGGALDGNGAAREDAATDAGVIVPPDGAVAVQLDIPPRSQWPNAGGYCGETSIQSIALHYGAWISQKVVRDVAGGELLLGVNDAKALDALHFAHTEWQTGAASPQFEPFALWTKKRLLEGAPVVFGVYLTDGTDDPDYDHIMPATGIASANATAYAPDDRLTFNDNFGDRLTRRLGDMSATRSSCASSSTAGGCIPRDVDYGVAISGVVDAQRVTLPTEVAVSSASEPNVSKSDSPAPMSAVVAARGLVAGASYALLRFDGYANVPTQGSEASFLASNPSARVDFTASGTTWTYADPGTFSSDGSVYWRCVRRP